MAPSATTLRLKTTSFRNEPEKNHFRTVLAFSFFLFLPQRVLEGNKPKVLRGASRNCFRDVQVRISSNSEAEHSFRAIFLYPQEQEKQDHRIRIHILFPNNCIVVEVSIIFPIRIIISFLSLFHSQLIETIKYFVLSSRYEQLKLRIVFFVSCHNLFFASNITRVMCDCLLCNVLFFESRESSVNVLAELYRTFHVKSPSQMN